MKEKAFAIFSVVAFAVGGVLCLVSGILYLLGVTPFGK